MHSTIMISMSQVPLYLQRSAFYLSLDPSDEEMFEVPANCLKPDTSIKSEDDLTHLLHSFRYWGMFFIARESIDYIMKNTKKEHLEQLHLEFPEYKYFLDRMLILITSKPHRVVVDYIHNNAGKGDVSYLHEKMGYELSPECWDAVFQKDEVAIMDYLLKKKVPSKVSWTFAAAASGSIKCLKYAHSAKLKIEANSLLVAVEKGHLKVVRFLHEVVGKPLTVRAMEQAAQSGNLTMMRYLHEKGCPWSITICDLLAFNDKLECLVFAHENGCPWDENTCSEAAYAGHLRCLKYAHTHGCLWDELTTRNARGMAHRDCLHYATEHGCEDPDESWESIYVRGGIFLCMAVLYFQFIMIANLHRMWQLARLETSSWYSGMAIITIMGVADVMLIALLVYCYLFAFGWVQTSPLCMHFCIVLLPVSVSLFMCICFTAQF